MPSFSGQRDKGIRVFSSGTQRVYIHPDPKPTSAILDYGLTELGGITFATPDPEQILIPDRTRFNQWERVGRIFQPEEFQSTDFTTTANGAGYDDWEDLRSFQVEFNMYITVGAAAEGASLQADDAHSWTQKAVIPDGLVTTNSPLGDAINSKSENSESMATGSIQYGNGVIARTVGFSSIGGAALTKDILDGVSLNRRTYSEFFGITTNTLATDPSAVVFVRTDKPTAGTESDLTNLGTAGVLDRCYIAGNALMVTRSEGTFESHGYASLDDIRAGNGAGAFNFVTSGYVASSGPVAAAVISEGNIILVGLLGYIYRLTNLTSAATVIDAGVLTTENFNDVDYSNAQVVAVADNNVVCVSNDGGINGWSSITGPSVGNALKSVSVVKENQWYIGTDNGELWFCEYDQASGTATYSAVTPFGATATAFEDIRFHAGETFGWFVGNGANLYRTTSAGVRVSSKTPEFARLSTVGFTTINGTASVDANETFVFGDAGKLGLGV